MVKFKAGDIVCYKPHSIPNLWLICGIDTGSYCMLELTGLFKYNSEEFFSIEMIDNSNTLVTDMFRV